MTSVMQTAPMAFVAQVVRIVNEGETPFNMAYGPRDRLVLQPGQQVFVPEEVAWHFMGRWWTDNRDPRSKARQQEVDRLHVLYGAYESTADWERNKPRLAVYTPDNERIQTVVDDPSGEYGASTQTQFGREQSMEAQMSIMRQQLLMMQAQLDANAKKDMQLPARTDEPPVPPSIPTVGSAHQTADMGGVRVPVAPRVITPTAPKGPGSHRPDMPRSVPVVAGDAIVGRDLPVTSSVAYMPPTTDADAPHDDVPVDEPHRVPTGGRIPAARDQ